MAFALPDRMALVYHNITPPEFFVDVHPLLVQLCYLGRRELGAYATRVELALGDSEYNRAELEELGFPETAVLPVVPDFSHLAGPPNYMQAGAFDDDWVNLLFVGRMIPNKRIEDVVRAFHAYKRWFNPRSRLLLVGSHGGFERYLAMLHDFVARIGAADVHVLGHVTNEELTAYYEVADVFLCASEHEGFCVPLMEAFHMGVPVLAYAATAVPATMDGGGILYHRKDPLEIAALVNAVVADGGAARARGRRVRTRRSTGCWPGTSAAMLLGFVERALGGRRRRDRRRWPSTSGIRSARPSGSKSCGSTARRPIRRCPKSRGSGLGAGDSEDSERRRSRPETRDPSPRLDARRRTRPDDRQPVGAGGPSGRCHRRLGAPGARAAAGDGPPVGPVRPDDRRRPRGDVRPFADPARPPPAT